MEVERKRWPHWPERGNGTARRDRLELRLFRDTERQAELARAPEREPRPTAGGYLVFVWTPGGYALREGEGEAPAAGNRLTLDGVEYTVAKLRRQPPLRLLRARLAGRLRRLSALP